MAGQAVESFRQARGMMENAAYAVHINRNPHLGKDRRKMLAVMLHGDDVAFNSGLKSVAQCAMVSLEMLQAIFNARFELLGVNEAMIALRAGL